MKCEDCREALSARLDGEPSPIPAGAVDQHTATCPACRAWSARADRLHRSIMVRVAPPVPDLSGAILDRTPGPGAERWPARIGLALVAVAQLTLAFAQLLGIAEGLHRGPDTGSTIGHLTHESSAWNLAVGIGLLWAAVRAKAAAGQLPVLTGFVVVLVALSASDAINGTVTAQRLLSHGLVLVGLLLLYLVHRQHRERHHPNPAPLAHPSPEQDIDLAGDRENPDHGAHDRHRGRFRRPAGKHHVA